MKNYVRNCYFAGRSGEVVMDLVEGRIQMDGYALLPLEMLMGERLQELATEETQTAFREMLERSSAKLTIAS